MSETRKKFLTTLADRFPNLAPQDLERLTADNLVADHVVSLPKKTLDQARAFIAASFRLRQSAAYQESLAQDRQARGLANSGNHGIAMSYDFHVDESGDLKLIEINTNASFLALGTLLYDATQMANPLAGFDLNALRPCLENELALVGKETTRPRVRIIDEEPEQQRLYLEFLVYRELFRSWGWPADIVDSRRLDPSEADLVYNRDTDFYLEKPELQTLKKAWLEKRICLSPHPTEYLYLADKQRQIDWHAEGFLARMGLSEADARTLLRHSPRARDLTSANAEALWAERKKYFFKPKRSFGAKQSYRGASISHKAFLELVDQEILAQEFVPAPEIEIQTREGSQKMKYDLRFYAYQDQAQTVVARLYQGQVTNLRTPHGGFTRVKVL